MYSYREAQKDDYRRICLFPQNEDELFYMFPRATYPLFENELEECASLRFQPTTFLSENKVAGYANIIKQEPGEYASVGNIIVSPVYRGKGLGRYILDVMSHTIKEMYLAKELRLSCFSSNISGLILYHKYGLIPYDMEARVDNNDAKVMLLHLKKEI